MFQISFFLVMESDTILIAFCQIYFITVNETKQDNKMDLICNSVTQFITTVWNNSPHSNHSWETVLIFTSSVTSE